MTFIFEEDHLTNLPDPLRAACTPIDAKGMVTWPDRVEMLLSLENSFWRLHKEHVQPLLSAVLPFLFHYAELHAPAFPFSEANLLKTIFNISETYRCPAHTITRDTLPPMVLSACVWAAGLFAAGDAAAREQFDHFFRQLLADQV